MRFWSSGMQSGERRFLHHPRAMTLEISRPGGPPALTGWDRRAGIPRRLRRSSADLRPAGPGSTGTSCCFGPGSRTTAPKTTSITAAAHVLENAWLTFGLPALIGTKKAFINFTRSLLVGGYGLSLPPPSAVIELLEVIEPDDEVMDACRLAQRAGGHLLAVDDYVHRPGMAPLIDLADVVKVNFRDSDPEEQRDPHQAASGGEASSSAGRADRNVGASISSAR